MQGKGADGKPAHTDIENRSKSTPGHFRASPLTNLCSELVEVFPEALKVARVTPMYKGGVLTIGRTNKFMPPPWYKGGVGGGGGRGGEWNPSPQFLICCSILKRFYLFAILAAILNFTKNWKSG